MIENESAKLSTEEENHRTVAYTPKEMKETESKEQRKPKAPYLPS